MAHKAKIWLAAISGVAFLFLLLPATSWAIDIYRQPEVKIFSSLDFYQEKAFLAYDQNFKGGGSVAVCDVNGDGSNEIITGAGYGGGPHVRIFKKNGTFLRGFFVYAHSFRKGINITCADLDGNGKAEIITGAGYGGGPHVRIFNSFGDPVFTPGFFAFNNDFRGGINVAAGDVNGDGKGEIIVGQGPGGHSVRVFDRFGKYLGEEFTPFDPSLLKGGVSVAVANVDGGKEAEIVMGVYRYGEPRVKVYKYNKAQQILGDFLAWDPNFQGGVSFASADFDNNGVDELAVAVGAQGGPQVRFYRADGEELKLPFFAYEESFRGGISIAVGNLVGSSRVEIVTMPRRLIGDGRTDLYKYIEIDLSDQTLAYYEAGVQLGKFRVSSGKPGMDTPTGTFHIMNKDRRAYSKKYDLYMPYWMQFYPGFGIHELPEWANGYKEGQFHLGIKVSHGCVRLGVGPAGEVYNWADIGTTVLIHD